MILTLTARMADERVIFYATKFTNGFGFYISYCTAKVINKLPKTKRRKKAFLDIILIISNTQIEKNEKSFGIYEE